MDASAAARALVQASVSLIDGLDVVDALAVLTDECRGALDVDAVILLRRELGADQALFRDGPCVDADASGRAVAAKGSNDLRHRYPAFAAWMSHAGFCSVHASPLRWQGSTIGAMGFLRRGDAPFMADEATFAQAFADVAASLIAVTGAPTVSELTARSERVLGGRIVIEQAKGVLAQRHGLGMAEAYDLMLRSWAGGHETLAEWSSEILREAGPG
jgi:hypothetical protein